MKPMTVQFLLTCLCDAFYGEVGIAAVRVLEHCGVAVAFPEEQTCCGQPPFNAGDREAALGLARRTLEVFDPQLPIVTPSSSCAAMLRHGYPMLGLQGSRTHSPGEAAREGGEGRAPMRAYELSEYLLDVLGVDRWPLRGSSAVSRRRAVYHAACHGRVLGLGDKPLRLLGLVPGLELVEPVDAEQCCGFGGAFSATHPTLSRGIGLEKLDRIRDSGCDLVIGGDMGCLMHLQTLADREGRCVRALHYAQVLAEALE